MVKPLEISFQRAGTHGGNVLNSTRFSPPPFFALCFVLGAAIILTPVLLFPIPPLLDYPNHLARLWLIEGGAELTPVSHFYAENWHGIATNIGIDVTAKIFKNVIPAFVLGRILLAVALLLPPVGAVALNVAIFGGWDPWHLLFLFFAFTLTLLAGFLNYQIGLGAALLCASVDGKLKLQTKPILYGARFGLGCLLILIHPFALVFYGALLVGIEFGPHLPKKNLTSWLRRFLGTVPAAAGCLGPVLLLLLWTHGLPGGANSGGVLFNSPLEALVTLDTPFFSYDVRVDALFALSIIVIVFYAARKRPIKIHAGLLAVAGILTVAALFVPSVTPESAWLDVRLPIMAVLAALAASRLSFGSTHRNVFALTVITLSLVISRTVWIAWNWGESVPMLESMRVVLANVPAGSAVLPMEHTPSSNDLISPPRGKFLRGVFETYLHYPALIVPWQHAFVPTLFAVAGAHPIRILPPWNQIAEPRGGGLPSVNAFRNSKLQPSYMQHWQSRFDYVLVLNADQPDRYGRFVPPAELSLIANAGFAELYRIRHGNYSNEIRSR